MRRLLPPLGLLAALGCAKVAPGGPAPDGGRAVAGRGALEREPPRRDETSFMREFPEVQPAEPCFVTGEPLGLSALLDRAAARFDASDFQGALRCAEEASRFEPSSIEAHHDRAAALLRLGRTDEARTALECVLALDPDDPETLAAAADLFINRLAPGPDVTEAGLELARRGARLVQRRRRANHERGLYARLSLLEAQAQNDLGRPREALSRADAALGVMGGLPSLDPQLKTDAEYERAVALFELCRFDDARKALSELVARKPDHAHAHQQLGLVLERHGDADGAASHFAQARKLAPDELRAPLELGAAEFARVVEKAVAELPAGLQRDLAGIPVEPAELPAESDLLLEDPPLSPTILGLFRGLPLHVSAQGGTSDEPRSIAIYRKNLLRVVTSKDELEREVRKTLLHEIGHLHGEDDGALRARGLE